MKNDHLKKRDKPSSLKPIRRNKINSLLLLFYLIIIVLSVSVTEIGYQVSGMVLPIIRRVHPQESSNKDDNNHNDTDEIDIERVKQNDRIQREIRVQAHIYNRLDKRMANSHANLRGRGNQSGRGLFSTYDDIDEDDNFHHKLNLSNPDAVILDLDEHSSSDDGRKSQKFKNTKKHYFTSHSSSRGFISVLNSFQEGNRLLQSEDEGQDDEESENLAQRFKRSHNHDNIYEDNKSLISTSSNQSLWNWSQINPRRRQNRHKLSVTVKPLRRERRSAAVNSNNHDDADDDEIEYSLRETNELNPVREEVCRSTTHQHTAHPLTCYECDSNSAENNPECDHRLFGYLKAEQKRKKRKRCGTQKSDYCRKIVRRKFGIRFTERKCVNGAITVPDINGNPIPVQNERCFHYMDKDRFIITDCFCESNLCNRASAHPLGTGGGLTSFCSLIATILAISMYGLALAFINNR